MITFLAKTNAEMQLKLLSGALDEDIYNYIDDCWNDTYSVPQPTGSNIYGFFGCETDDGYCVDYTYMENPSKAKDPLSKGLTLEFKRLIDRIYRLFEIAHVEGSKALTKEQRDIWHKCEDAHRHTWERCLFGKTVSVWTKDGESGVWVKYENDEFYHYDFDAFGKSVWY